MKFLQPPPPPHPSVRCARANRGYPTVYFRSEGIWDGEKGKAPANSCP